METSFALRWKRAKGCQPNSSRRAPHRAKPKDSNPTVDHRIRFTRAMPVGQGKSELVSAGVQ